jgi:excisionase family DNA binding protein
MKRAVKTYDATEPFTRPLDEELASPCASAPAPTSERSDANEPDFFSPDTVAGILRVDRKTVYGAIKTGALRALRLGRVIRIPAAAISKIAGVPITRRRARRAK